MPTFRMVFILIIAQTFWDDYSADITEVSKYTLIFFCIISHPSQFGTSPNVLRICKVAVGDLGGVDEVYETAYPLLYEFVRATIDFLYLFSYPIF